MNESSNSTYHVFLNVYIIQFNRFFNQTYCQNHPSAIIQVSYFGSICAVVGISGHISIICNFIDDDLDLCTARFFSPKLEIPKEKVSVKEMAMMLKPKKEAVL